MTATGTVRRATCTADDDVIATLTDALDELYEIGSGPRLDPEVLQRYEHIMPVEDAQDCDEYGVHLTELLNWSETFASATGIRCEHTVSSSLIWSETLITDPHEEVDPHADAEDAAVSIRVNAEPQGQHLLFDVSLDYYVTGEVHCSVTLTTGYEAQSADVGGDRLTSWYPIDSTLDSLSREAFTAALEEIHERGPYVLSRVYDLVSESGAKLSRARAQALSECGLSTSDIADRLGVSNGAVRSYTSKFREGTRNAERRLVTTVGGPKTVLATHTVDDSEGRVTGYLCRTHEAQFDEPFSLVVVTEQQAGPSPSLSVSTTSAASVPELHDAADDTWVALFEHVDDEGRPTLTD
jgi:hypothetical protein